METKAGEIRKLTPGKKMGVEINGKPVLLTNVEGKVYAIGNKCTHQGCKLSDGSLSGKILRCVCHGSQFDVTTGRVVAGPAKKDEPSYKVLVKDDDILVDA